MLKTILFDLDGTLLPMDQDLFTKAYFQRLAQKLMPHGYEPKALVDGIWAGTAAMVKNDGTRTNEEAFWKRFSEIFGEKSLEDRPVLDEYYRQEFQEVAGVCGYNPKAKETVEQFRQAGLRLALATNPIFPAVATESRIRWAGLTPEDFVLYTTYENIGWCKPNPEYYRELLRRLECPAEECLMVGNDATEDTAALEQGIGVYLVTDCLLNPKGRDISGLPQGTFAACLEFAGV